MNRVLKVIFMCVLILGFSSNARAQEFPAFFQTHHDKIPNFAQKPTIRSVQSGAWSNPASWTPARLPHATDVVLISHAITYDSITGISDTIGIAINGVLRFANNQSTILKVGTLQVQPGGTLEVGAEQSPIPAHFTAEIIIRNKPLDLTNDGNGVYDPQQWGTGLVVVDGKIAMHGASKSATFVRLAQEPKVGNTTLALTQSVTNWRAGDRVIIPDTRHLKWNEVDSNYRPQWEELVIQSTSNTTLTLSSPLQYDHPGGRDGNGNLEFLPHAGNLTRNIVVRSENPNGTRGHIALTNLSQIDLRYALFKDLGRTTHAPLDNTTFDTQGTVTHVGTNQVGRYMLHLHHVMGETSSTRPYLFVLQGNAVDGGSLSHPFKWGIATHNSKYGLIKDNVVYNVSGAGIAFEEGDGREDFNILERNFVVRVTGAGCSRADNCFPGREGDGFWLRGTNNYIRENVAANAALHGYTFFGGGPFLEFARNEYYGGRNGLTMWEINGSGTANPNPSARQSTVQDFVVWHAYEYGVGLGYPTYNVTFDGLVVRGDKAALSGTGWEFGDYVTKGIIIRNADISGIRIGVMIPTRNLGSFLIENSRLQNYYNIINTTIGAPGGINGVPLTSKETIIRNVKFDGLSGVPSLEQPQGSILMQYQLYGSNSNLTLANKVLVYDYNQIPGNNFQVFFKEQTSDFIMPQTSGLDNFISSPDPGLTNQQNWNKYGISIAGAITPCVDQTSRPEIKGLVCSLDSSAQPPPRTVGPPLAPSNITVTILN